jgi:hypothetical protein
MRVLFAPIVAVTVLALAATSALASPTLRDAAPNAETGKTADQILADSERAAVTARSVHVVGHGVSGVPLSFDLYLLAGEGGRGQIATNGLSFELVRIGQKAYFEASTAFWRHYGNRIAATLLHGRWIEAPATHGDLASFTPLTDLVALVRGALGSHGVLKVGAATMVDGHRVIPLIDTTQGGTLYVAATGPPYPLGIKGKGGKGSISFEGWNEAVTLRRPANAIPYSELNAHH